MTLTLRSTILSDPGLVRSNNEDAGIVGDRLLAVADGMGGLPAGEVASEIVIGILAAQILALSDEPLANRLADFRAAQTALVLEDALERLGVTATITEIDPDAEAEDAQRLDSAFGGDAFQG